MRLDLALVARGLARSRTHAQQLITAGRVLVDGGQRGDIKASTIVRSDDQITVDTDGYVGRAAGKLAGALDAFPDLAIHDRVVLDAGASTGGFTQILLERGARAVYALDVGHGQLAPSLVADPRVINVEGTNIRELSLDDLPHPATARAIDLVVGDLSFISLTLVLPVLAAQIRRADYVMLVKPQFEVGRGRVGRGGVVSRPELWAESIENVLHAGESAGLSVAQVIPSQVRGESGNQEFFVRLHTRVGDDRREWKELVTRAVARAERRREGDRR